MIDPTQWKDLPYVIAFILFVLMMTYLLYKMVKVTVDFLRLRDTDYQNATRKMFEDQSTIWRAFVEKQDTSFMGFIREMTERTGDGQDAMVNSLKDLATSMSKQFRDVLDKIDSVDNRLAKHDERVGGKK